MVVHEEQDELERHQYDHEETTVKSIALTRAFGIGYREGMKLKPWRNIDEFVRIDSVINYERGRQFAAWMKCEGYEYVPLKLGKKLNDDCLYLVYHYDFHVDFI